MEKKCCKCKDIIEKGSILVEGGNLYHFCEYCSEKVSSAPDTNSKISEFLRMSKKEWIERNMRLAREERSRGQGAWSRKKIISV